MQEGLGNGLLLIGGVLIVIGILAKYGLLGWFGHLPGDISVKGENSAFYFPITTMIVLSILLSVVINLLRRF